MAELKNLTIDEVSFVDEGANPQANILLFKRKQVKKDGVDELTAALKDLTDKLNAQTQLAEREQFRILAERYEILGTDSAQLAQLLQAASLKNPQLYETAVKVLDNALNVVQKSGTFAELGKSGFASKNSSQNELHRLAAQIQKRKPDLTWRQALDEAYMQHPELQEV